MVLARKWIEKAIKNNTTNTQRNFAIMFSGDSEILDNFRKEMGLYIGCKDLRGEVNLRI